MAESAPGKAEMMPQQNGNLKIFSSFPRIEKSKSSVLPVIDKLLDDLKKEEVLQIQALLTARIILTPKYDTPQELQK